MTFDQLEIFEKIIEMGSFKAAAAALHRTQPTLSVAIKKLEEEFDLLLFNRDSYRPTLTPEGEVFAKWSRQALNSYRELNVIGRELGMKKVEPKISIVIDPLVRFTSLHPIFEQCLAQQNPTELTLHSEALEGSLDRLLEGSADIAIAPSFRKHRDIESHPFGRIELVPCIKSELWEKGKSPESFLANFTQIIVKTPGDRQIREQPELRAGILETTRKCYVTDHGIKRELIRAGYGWGRLSRDEIVWDLKNSVLKEATCPNVKSIHLEVHLMRNRRNPMGPISKTIWERMLQASQT